VLGNPELVMWNLGLVTKATSARQ